MPVTRRRWWGAGLLAKVVQGAVRPPDAGSQLCRPAQLSSLLQAFNQLRNYCEPSRSEPRDAELGHGSGCAESSSVPAASDEAKDLGPRLTGIVKSFNRVKGYGFIIPDAGGPDVFVHFANIVSEEEFRSLKAGTPVEYGLFRSERDGLQRVCQTLIWAPLASTVYLVVVVWYPDNQHKCGTDQPPSALLQPHCA